MTQESYHFIQHTPFALFFYATGIKAKIVSVMDDDICCHSGIQKTLDSPVLPLGDT